MSNFIFDNIGGQTKMKKKKRIVLKDFKKPQKIKKGINKIRLPRAPPII